MNLENGNLKTAGRKLLSGLGNAEAIDDALGCGLFLRFAAEKNASRHVFSLGKLAARRWLATHRYEPFWMLPKTGSDASAIPPETQFLLVEITPKRCAVFVPLIDGIWRAALQGNAKGALELVCESGDAALAGREVTGLFVAVGEDPFALMKAAARSVAAFVGTRLREEKSLPDFVEQFGWCTWDAFYQEVSHDKVREGLESFKAGGVQPKYLILDDGWQSAAEQSSGEKRLTAFAANEKFPGDLKNTVAMAKGEYEIENFLVWHAMNGYWGGVDEKALPGYGVQSRARHFNEGIKHHEPTIDSWFGGVVGTVSPDHIYRFFQDYHRHLQRQGVDGVKVDSQATLEGVAQGFGGRVEMMRRYHEALEGSVHVHFGGSLINCMSNANEMYFTSGASNLTRTSTDFWPNRPASHGLHLWTNAMVSLFWSEFAHPDWDMFQSGHPMGAYHAAARAISGSPVYVSDKPDAHDFALLKKLVLPDGAVLRCPTPALPTRDCLFADVTSEDALLKIWNTLPQGAVIGAFNARYEEKAKKAKPIEGCISPADVPGLEGVLFAVYAHNAGEGRLLMESEEWRFSLAQLEFEIFTIARVEGQGDRGVAAIGLPDMFNSGEAIGSQFWLDDETFVFTPLHAGSYLLWCSDEPLAVELEDDDPVSYSYDKSTRRLTVEMTCNHAHSVFVRFG